MPNKNEKKKSLAELAMENETFRRLYKDPDEKTDKYLINSIPSRPKPEPEPDDVFTSEDIILLMEMFSNRRPVLSSTPKKTKKK